MPETRMYTLSKAVPTTPAVMIGGALAAIAVFATLLLLGTHHVQPQTVMEIAVPVEQARPAAIAHVAQPPTEAERRTLDALAALTDQVKQVNGRIDGVQQGLNTFRSDMTARADRMDGKLGKLSTRVDEIANRVAADEKRMDTIETRLSPVLARGTAVAATPATGTVAIPAVAIAAQPASAHAKVTAAEPKVSSPSAKTHHHHHR